MKNYIEDRFYSDIRNDNALVIKFLTSSASALFANHLICQKDINNLRISLNGVGLEGSKFILDELVFHDDIVLTYLKTRFGNSSFHRNLNAHTLRPHLVNSSNLMIKICELLLEKSRLLFNRPFYLYENEICVKQTLYSTFLIESSELLMECIKPIQQTVVDYCRMIGCGFSINMDLDQKIDSAISEELGFLHVDYSNLAVTRENLNFSNIRTSILVFMGIVKNLIIQISMQSNSQSILSELSLLDSICENMETELFRLDLTSKSKRLTSENYELKRQNIFKAFSAINASILEIYKILQTYVNKVAINHSPNIEIPQSLHNYLTLKIMEKGISVEDSKKATNDLIVYIKNHNITPNQLIHGEMTKINENLIPESLDIVQSYWKSMNGIPLDETQKSLNIQKTKNLKNLLKEAMHPLGQICLAILICMVMFSCGVKKDPVSEAVEFERAIPLKKQIIIKDGIKEKKNEGK